jgi:hypothetical protein
MNGGNMIVAPPNGKATIVDWGSHSLNLAWMGDINFIDMGDYKIDKYTNKDLPWTNFTWGGLIRYQGLEAYFRYEGKGEVKVVIDRFGGVNLSFKQGGMMVKMDDLRVVPYA